MSNVEQELRPSAKISGKGKTMSKKDTNVDILGGSGKPKVTIFVDGASKGNPGLGGWGAVLISGSKGRAISGPLGSTTNSRAELLAVINSLNELKMSCEVLLFSDSQYVVQGMETWLKNWVSNGFIRADGKPVANQDLWENIIQLWRRHAIKPEWIRGHSGNRFQEQSDALASQAAEFQMSKDDRFDIE